MESSPRGVGDRRPLQVDLRQAMSGGSVPVLRLGKGLEFLPTQPWRFTFFSTSALWTRPSGESDVVVHVPIAGVRQASWLQKYDVRKVKVDLPNYKKRGLRVKALKSLAQKALKNAQHPE